MFNFWLILGYTDHFVHYLHVYLVLITWHYPVLVTWYSVPRLGSHVRLHTCFTDCHVGCHMCRSRSRGPIRGLTAALQTTWWKSRDMTSGAHDGSRLVVGCWGGHVGCLVIGHWVTWHDVEHCRWERKPIRGLSDSGASHVIWRHGHVVGSREVLGCWDGHVGCRVIGHWVTWDVTCAGLRVGANQRAYRGPSDTLVEVTWYDVMVMWWGSGKVLVW